MARPCRTMSSPTLTMAVMSSGGTTRTSPRASGRPRRRRTGPPARREHRSGRSAARPAAPGTIAARHASAHPIGSARDRGVGPAGGGTGQRRRRGVRRARTSSGGRRSLTFAQWDRAADGVAGHLARLGVAKGDVVCLLLPSSIDYAVLYAALLRLGAITSGINPRMGAGEVASIVERPRRCCWWSTPRRRRLPDAARPRWSTRAEAPDAGGTNSRPDAGRSWPRPIPVAVVWTSGTTGRPKGALFDHANLAAVARGHRRAEPAGRPAALAAAVRPRRLHDPGLGRDRQRRDDRHHPHAVAGGRRHPRHGGRGGSRWPRASRRSGRSCWPARARRRPTRARCAWPGRARRA